MSFGVQLDADLIEFSSSTSAEAAEAGVTDHEGLSKATLSTSPVN